MSLLVIFEAHVAPGDLEGVEAGFAEVLPETRTRPGCESVTLHRSQNTPGAIVLVERWASRERHEEYLAWRQAKGDPKGLAARLHEPSISYFDDVDA